VKKPERERGTWKPGTKLTMDIRGALPVPKGSMRGFIAKGHGGKPRAILTDGGGAELRAWERDIRLIAEGRLIQNGIPCAKDQPFEFLAVFYLPRPNGDYDKHGGIRLDARCSPWTKPDWDKLSRAACDALKGLAYDDDCRIVRAVVEKRFATKERSIGLWIELRVLPATLREQAALAQPKLAV
jgi:Holliday junction resolvase RusA-like endonuclease